MHVFASCLRNRHYSRETVLGKHENQRRSTQIHRKKIRSFVQRTDVSGDDSAGPTFARWRGCEPRCPPQALSPLNCCSPLKQKKERRTRDGSSWANAETAKMFFFLFSLFLVLCVSSLKTTVYSSNMINWSFWRIFFEEY